MDTNDENDLLIHLEKIHTTDLGVMRIKRNLSLDSHDVVSWCKAQIQDPNSSIVRKGKNWYIYLDPCVITVNASSYTIITAHRIRK
jgi:hypothetical protein